MSHEGLVLKTHFRVDIYRVDLLPQGFECWPAERRARWYEMHAGEAVLEEEGNMALTEGVDELWTLLCGGSATPYNNSNARIGVGDGDAAAAADQTGLQGSNTEFKGMMATYPQFGSDGEAVFKAEFLSGEGNFHWREYTVDNGSSANKNLNRRVVDHGVKSSGVTRTITVTFTLS